MPPLSCSVCSGLIYRATRHPGLCSKCWRKDPTYQQKRRIEEKQRHQRPIETVNQGVSCRDCVQHCLTPEQIRKEGRCTLGVPEYEVLGVRFGRLCPSFMLDLKDHPAMACSDRT